MCSPGGVASAGRDDGVGSEVAATAGRTGDGLRGELALEEPAGDAAFAAGAGELVADEALDLVGAGGVEVEAAQVELGVPGAVEVGVAAVARGAAVDRGLLRRQPV